MARHCTDHILFASVWPMAQATTLYRLHAVPVRICITREQCHHYSWVISLIPMSQILSTRVVISSVPVKVCSTYKVIGDVWGEFRSFSFMSVYLQVLHILTGTKDVTHRYCISSWVLHILTGAKDMTRGYWGYHWQLLGIWLTGTEDMTHGYWGYDSWVLRIWLMGTACPYRYWGYDTQVMHILTGTEVMTHGYCISSQVQRIWHKGNAYPYGYRGYDSRALHILMGMQIWLTGTADMTHGYWRYDSVTEDMTHGYWRYDSWVLKIWLMGIAYPHRYWGYDSRVLRIILMGTAYPYRYRGYKSQVMLILRGTEDIAL